METFLTAVHILVCVFLVVVVLLQHGKGADMGAAFGGGSQTIFGSTGAATLLHKITIGAAALFMLTSIVLVKLNARESTTSIMKQEAPSEKTVIPDQPQPKKK